MWIIIIGTILTFIAAWAFEGYDTSAKYMYALLVGLLLSLIVLLGSGIDGKRETVESETFNLYPITDNMYVTVYNVDDGTRVRFVVKGEDGEHIENVKSDFVTFVDSNTYQYEKQTYDFTNFFRKLFSFKMLREQVKHILYVPASAIIYE